MKSLLTFLGLYMLCLMSFAQIDGSSRIGKRLPLAETPDSMTPGACNYVDVNLSRMLSSFFGLSFEYTFARREGFRLEVAYKPAITDPHLPNRYKMFPSSTSRKASSIWSGKLSYRYYFRAGKKSFFYVGPYYRFDYLDADNVLIYDCYDSDYPAYLFTRSTRLYICGLSMGCRYMRKDTPFYFGISFGGGFADDSNSIVQLKPLEYEDPRLDYPYALNEAVYDLTFDFGFYLRFRKHSMFKE